MSDGKFEGEVILEGFEILPKYRRKGYGIEAIKQLFLQEQPKIDLIRGQGIRGAKAFWDSIGMYSAKGEPRLWIKREDFLKKYALHQPQATGGIGRQAVGEVPRGSGIVEPSDKAFQREPSLPVASRIEPSGATILTSKLPGVVKSTNQILSSNRINFLKSFSITNPSKAILANYRKEVESQGQAFLSAQPAKDWWESATPQEYQFCLHEKGLYR